MGNPREHSVIQENRREIQENTGESTGNLGEFNEKRIEEQRNTWNMSGVRTTIALHRGWMISNMAAEAQRALTSVWN